jgi:seryl-tRNA synthetase
MTDFKKSFFETITAHDQSNNKNDITNELTEQLKQITNKYNILQTKITEGKNLPNMLEEIKCKMETFENIKNELCSEFESIQKEKNAIENKLEEELEKINQDEIDLAMKVIDALCNVNDKEYLVRCIKYLRSDYCVKWDMVIKLSIDELVAMEENKIIKKAHKMFNNRLVRFYGPHTFTHNHDDHDKCQWDGNDECRCGCKCPVWRTKHVDWQKDFNLNSMYPVGYAECSW